INTGMNGQPTPYSITTQSAQTSRILLSKYDSRDGDILYAMLIQPTSGGNQMVGIFRLANDAPSGWVFMGIPGSSTEPPDAGQGNIHFAIEASEENAQAVFVAGDRRTDDDNDDPSLGTVYRGVIGVGGTAWTSIVGYEASDVAENKPHADSRALVATGSRLYDLTDGGIYIMNNADLEPRLDDPEWQSANGNMSITE